MIINVCVCECVCCVPCVYSQQVLQYTHTYTSLCSCVFHVRAREHIKLIYEFSAVKSLKWKCFHKLNTSWKFRVLFWGFLFRLIDGAGRVLRENILRKLPTEFYKLKTREIGLWKIYFIFLWNFRRFGHIFWGHCLFVWSLAKKKSVARSIYNI